jgi:putative spermidine/putrescine transport system ATP-binding protein
VMNRGAIEQLADPAAIYRRPATAFALGFVGLSTRFSGKVTEAAAGLLTIRTAFGLIRAPAQFLPGSPVVVGIRPERIRIGKGQDGENEITAELVEVAFQGARAHLFFAAADGQHVMAEVPEIPAGAAPGTRMLLSWAPEDTLVYPAEPDALAA